MKILITGTAGFIGFHLANKLLVESFEIVGIDSLNDYYDVNLKNDRLRAAGIDIDAIEYGKLVNSSINLGYSFVKIKLEDKVNLDALFATQKFDFVINLAAQAGVRYSLTNPSAYIDSNIVGFLNIIECCRYNKIKHLVFASSSSVYGLNEKVPFSTDDSTDHPISLYAASKKSNELMAHVYSHLYNIPTTGLRFFTVYGPWGRPDMAMHLFTKAITEGDSIKVFNNGEMERDFTYVDDIVDGIVAVLNNPPRKDKDGKWDGLNPVASGSSAPYRIYNIGNSKPVKLMKFINAIEERLKKTAIKEMMPMQMGDVLKTYADVSPLSTDFGYSPKISVEEGVGKFVDWYTSYYM